MDLGPLPVNEGKRFKNKNLHAFRKFYSPIASQLTAGRGLLLPVTGYWFLAGFRGFLRFFKIRRAHGCGYRVKVHVSHK
jgi:hypothetical protein